MPTPAEIFDKYQDLPAKILWKHYPKTSSTLKEDAIQEGTAALLEQVGNFDGSLEEFGRWVYPRIKKAIYLFLLRESSPAYLPKKDRRLEVVKSITRISLQDAPEIFSCGDQDPCTFPEPAPTDEEPREKE